MYCPKCGALLQEGAGFCTNCGSSTSLTPPEDDPLQAAPGTPAKKRPGMIAPMILSAISAVLFFVLMCYILIQLRSIKLSGFASFRSHIVPILSVLVPLLAFLYCLRQHKHGETSLYAGACAALVVKYFLQVLSEIGNIIDIMEGGASLQDACSTVFSGSTMLYLLLYCSAIVLFVFALLAARKGTISKPFGIIGACVLLMLALLSLTGSTGWTVMVNFFAQQLLGVAMLLIAILWRPLEI